MNSFFKKMRNSLLKSLEDIRFRNLFLYIVLILQMMTLLFGIICNGAGNAQDFEIRAKMYTRINKTIGQTYSLVVPPNKSMSMSYLKDHIRGIEKDPVMKKNCKLFYVNRIIKNLDSSPFVLSLDEQNINTSIVYTVDTIDPTSYFELDILYGETISRDNDILIPLDVANIICDHLDSLSCSSLIGKTIINKNDDKEYVIRGIFNDKIKYLNHFVSNNFIIGSFTNFSGNNVNHALAFSTGTSYLENLFFTYRMSYYINPPNYNRQIVVSLTGNDFDSGGNVDITRSIYGFQATSPNMFIKVLYYFSLIGFNVATIAFYYLRRVNKKEVLFLSLSFFAFVCVFSVLGFLLDLSIVTSANLRINMTLSTNIFVISLITFIINYIICLKKSINRMRKRTEFYEIDI